MNACTCTHVIYVLLLREYIIIYVSMHQCIHHTNAESACDAHKDSSVRIEWRVLIIRHKVLCSVQFLANDTNSHKNRNRNLGISRAPLLSQAHQGTSLFTNSDQPQLEIFQTFQIVCRIRAHRHSKVHKILNVVFHAWARKCQKTRSNVPVAWKTTERTFTEFDVVCKTP